MPTFRQQIKSFLVPGKFVRYCHPTLAELCGEFELIGFPPGWDREKIDAQPHWYMNLLREYFGAKHAYEASLLKGK